MLDLHIIFDLVLKLDLLALNAANHDIGCVLGDDFIVVEHLEFYK
jgi:hypothetical protein